MTLEQPVIPPDALSRSSVATQLSHTGTSVDAVFRAMDRVIESFLLDDDEDAK